MSRNSNRIVITSSDARKYLAHAKGVLLTLSGDSKYASKTLVVEEAVILGKRALGVRTATVLYALDLSWTDELAGKRVAVSIPYGDILSVLDGNQPKSFDVVEVVDTAPRNMIPSAGYGAGFAIMGGVFVKLRASYSGVYGRLDHTKWKYLGASF